MVTVILFLVLVIYIILLIVKYKNKSNTNMNWIIQFVQGIIWCVLAADNWHNSHIAVQIGYIVIILLSFITGIQEFIKCKK